MYICIKNKYYPIKIKPVLIKISQHFGMCFDQFLLKQDTTNTYTLEKAHTFMLPLSIFLPLVFET